MTEIIAALQEEIAAAQKERDYYYELGNRWDSVRDEKAARKARLNGIMTEKYIEGLQTAVDLLTKEAVPFTAENGDCSFMENGDLR